MAAHSPDPSPVKTAEATVEEAGAADATTMRDHWRCLAACTLVSMCPFQYGIDFGLIGGMQAMTGFLKVRCARSGLVQPCRSISDLGSP